jgi:carbamoyltransferase
MLIAGVNVGESRNGMALKDGGACILADGNLLTAIAEERVTKRKHAGGYDHALRYCLNALRLNLSDLDMLVVSNCADLPLTDGFDIGLDLPPSKVRAMPSHHLSHASCAYYNSPFDESVIMVVDNEGNILSPGEQQSYYETRVERNSYYVAVGTRIEALLGAEDGLADDEIGPGEVYRHFTYYLGWHSYVYAGKTMGLAPYGHRDNLTPLRVFDLKAGKIRCILRNGGKDPIAAVQALGEKFGVALDEPRPPGASTLTAHHKDVAAFVQHELEEALLYKLRHLHAMTHIDNLCLGGGVAMNCVANERILKETPFRRLYVPPAPGDSGQCIGNALYGWWNWADHSPAQGPVPVHRRTPAGPYLGIEYTVSDYLEAINSASDMLDYHRSTALSSETAEMLSKGMVVAWFQGRSEMGPRALGNRSILADARLPGMRDYLNHGVKHREDFRPLAPVILSAALHKYFEAGAESPFMEVTARIRDEYRNSIPSVVHVDGSSRVQTVSMAQNRRLAELLTAFEDLTGIPLLLNTSFNLGGDPIVESPRDAVECFVGSSIDVLVLGDFIVRGNQEGIGYHRTREVLWTGSAR